MQGGGLPPKFNFLDTGNLFIAQVVVGFLQGAFQFSQKIPSTPWPPLLPKSF